MDDVIDEVAIRLVADGTEALEAADRIADEMEAKGEEAGRAFMGKFSSEMAAEAGQAVRQVSEHMSISFERAAKAIQAGPQPFADMEAEQMVEFANALKEMGVGLTDVSEKFSLTNEQLTLFSSIVKGEAAPATEEQSEFLQELMTHAEELGIVLDEQTVDQLKKLVEVMEEYSKEGADFEDRTEQMKAGILEQVETMALAEQQVRKVVDAYREMGIAIPDALQRDKIRQHVKALREHADQFSDVGAEANRFTDAIIDQGKNISASEGILGKFGGVLQSLGFSFGGLLKGASAFKILADIIQGTVAFIKESINYAVEFTDTSRDMAAAIRVNSVAGKENTMTFREWEDVAKEIAEVTGAKLAASYETVSMALRELGASTELSDKQIEDLIQDGARWAEIYGEELPGGLRKLTQFINTGYGMALKQLGLELSKTAQNQKAMELGLGTNIDKLSESQQEMVRYIMLMEELELRTEGVAIQTDTFADRLDAVETQTESAKKTLGDLFVPVSVKMKEFWANVKEGFSSLTGIVVIAIQKLVAEVTGHLMALSATVKYVLDNIGESGFWEKMEDLPELYKKIKDEASFELLLYSVQQATGATEELKQAAEGAGESIDEMGESIETTAEQLESFIEEARKFDQGMEKITRKLQQSIADIEEQFRQRRARSETDLQRDMRDIDRDAAIDRLEAIRDFQIDEIRMREDHQRDIHQLEERYLLDLEDAVRDRDARQVLQLQRRFNLEKKHRTEDYNLRAKRRREDLSFELQDITYRRMLRRQERIAAFMEEMSDLAAQEEMRKEQAHVRAERQRVELLEQIKNRLLALTEAAEGELSIEKEKLDALVEALNQVYGEDGPWVQWHQAAVEVTQGAAEGIADANQQIVDNLSMVEIRIMRHLGIMQQAATQAGLLGAAITGTVGGGGGGGRSAFRQRGGTIFATSPTSFTAGEGRPERVDITPLSQATGQPAAGFQTGSDRISIDLNIDASEMLAVSVADQTMSEIADVFVNITQRSFQGGRGV